jgi:hypothetical protein
MMLALFEVVLLLVENVQSAVPVADQGKVIQVVIVHSGLGIVYS